MMDYCLRADRILWPVMGQEGLGTMSIFYWFQSAVAWLQADGRLDLVTLGLALATFIYVAVAVAISIRSDLRARRDQAKANSRIAAVKRAAEHPVSRTAAAA